MAVQKMNKYKLIECRGDIDLNNPQNYIPWIKTNEFTKSLGTRYCIKDLFNGRAVHLMSGLEKDYYLTTRWEPNVIEIFEQYPLLPTADTFNISRELGYRYPKVIYSNELVVMTTDFLILAKDKKGKLKWFARSIKPKAEIYKNRVKEKLKIEQVYWENKGIQWALITEENINKIKADNIMWMSQGLFDGKDTSFDFDYLRDLIINKEKIDINKKLDFDLIKKIVNEDMRNE